MSRTKRLTLQISTIFAILITALSSPVVLRAQDRIAPSAPSGLIANATSCSHVSLSWTASTDEAGGSGLYAYTIQRSEGGKLEQEVTIGGEHNTFSDTNHVKPPTTLTYTVIAIDRAGNKSAASNAETVAIPPCSNSSNEQISGDFEGQFEEVVEDGKNENRTLYFLRTAKERLSLQFAANPPRRLRTGSHVHV